MVGIRNRLIIWKKLTKDDTIFQEKKKNIEYNLGYDGSNSIYRDILKNVHNYNYNRGRTED